MSRAYCPNCGDVPYDHFDCCPNCGQKVWYKVVHSKLSEMDEIKRKQQESYYSRLHLGIADVNKSDDYQVNPKGFKVTWHD